MLVVIFLYILFLAFLHACLEIQIEGRNGWAKELPTWRIKIKFLSGILDNQPITGYHLFMTLFVLMFFHLPLLFIGWSLKGECFLLGLYFLFILVEDFLWFILNPHFGLKNFKKGKIPWRPIWWWKMPRSYYINIALIVLFIYLGLRPIIS